MKKITITAAIIPILLSGFVLQTDVSASSKTKELIKLPKLDNKNVAKHLKEGNYMFQLQNGVLFKLNDKFGKIEKSLGLPNEKLTAKNDYYTGIEATYGKTPLKIHAFSNHKEKSLSTVKIEKVQISYNRNYDLKTINKYFGKAASTYKENDKTLLKTYGPKLEMTFKKDKGQWKITSLTSVDDNPILTIPSNTRPTEE